MNRFPTRLGLLISALLALPGVDGLAQERAEPVATRVVVRVVSRDAKIIGSGVGGALVRVVNAETGELLAEGRQEGGTGDTELIMSTPRARGMSIYDTEGAAGFVAELELAEPTVVNISALGPLGHPQAIQSASKRLLVLPGKHIEGDGVVLELHGFIVEIELPEPLALVEDSMDVQARVRMMCGCPLAPGGLWNSDGIEIVTRLWANGEVVSVSQLAFSGEASVFTGSLPVPRETADRDLELEVVAADRESVNFGRHRIPLGGRLDAEPPALNGGHGRPKR